MGEQESDTIFWSNAIEAGNKCLINTGLLSLWGKPIGKNMLRLLAPAYPGDTTIQVDTSDISESWGSGDTLLFAPTSYDRLSTEEREIDSIASGTITLKTALQNYHWGAAASPNIGGIDTRGEVIHSSRNVRIIGDTSRTLGKGWGC